MSPAATQRRARTRNRTRRHGVIGLALVLSVITLAGLSYGQVFTSVVMVEVDAPRSGLLLDPRAKVTARGVNIGDVRELTPVDGRARLRIAVRSRDAERIPANALAEIRAPTVFGAKFVALTVPPNPRGRIQDGDVLRTAAVTTEVNTIFEHLMALLTTTEPAKLNATLGAVSTALQGRGDDIGRYLVALNDFLVRFNPALPTVQRDVRSGADVANILGDASPDILRVLDNGAVLAQTLQDKQAGLDALFLSFTRLGRDATSLLRTVGPPLDAAGRVLRPTTGLAARYSPQLPCLLAGTNLMRTKLERIIGGPEFPGLDLYTSVLPPQPGYRNPADLPEVGARDAPDCRRNPLPQGSTNTPYTKIDDGVTTVDFTRGQGVGVAGPGQLAAALFGPTAIPLVGSPSTTAPGAGR